MAELGEGLSGYLDVQDATLRAPRLEAVSNIGIANTAPQHAFSVGSNLYVDTESSNVLTVKGNVVTEGIKMGFIEITPSYDFAAVSNVGNTTSNIIQFANATTGFTTTANVEIGGNITLTANAQVKVGSNVLAEYTGPHGRDPTTPLLKKFPEVVFDASKLDGNDTTNTYTQAGYTVSASSQLDLSPYRAWNTFDGNIGNEGWHSYAAPDSFTGTVGGANSYNGTSSLGGISGAWLKLELPHKIRLSSIDLLPRDYPDQQEPKDFKILGSNDDTNWVELIDVVGATWTQGVSRSFSVTGEVQAYKYLAISVSRVAGSTVVILSDLKYYGYEEPAPLGDLSLDTTLKSTFNSVRSNNYVMYFDGDGFDPNDTNSNNLVTGSSVSVVHHNATYDSTEKYWTLDGSTESNVTTGSLGLVGDAPHTVSTWINASNLEANATTQQLFSIGSGYDKSFLKVDDTQIAANTWHNVTYAYQGEGGSKVTYVDGRKVEEAQAEDTFGEYPPFAMTDYETGGYRVSASSDYLSDVNALRNAYKVYNATIGTAGVWMTDFGTFNTNAVGGNTFTDSDGGTHTGHWNKLELPYKLKPSYFYFKNSGLYTSSRNATNWVILGSNNDSDWDLLHSSTVVLNTTLNIPIIATKGYTYLMFLCKSINADTALYMEEIRFYGHKEGDLTRFPEPTRVLKYPHVALSGPARRGYVVQTSGNNATSNDGWKAFNGVGFNGQTNAGDHWITPDLYTHDTGAFEHASTAIYQPLGTGATGAGAWIAIKSPHKIKLTKLRVDNVSKAGFRDYTIHGRNGGGTIVGGTSWSPALLTVVDEGSGYSQSGNYVFTETSHNITTNDYYEEFIIIITKKTPASGTGDNFLLMRELEFYGTEENTGTPAIVGGPFAGKVANFRVYDQYLGDERIQEIYDAQKDTFGHKKSSMTLYKGRVGVGTTEPEGALTVIDEPHALAKFPARAVSADDSYVEGDGQIKLSAVEGSGYQAFDGLTSTSWTAAPTRNTRLSEEVDFGAWLKIQTPESVSLKKAEIESNPYWRQVGDTFQGAGAGYNLGKTVACNKDGTRIAIAEPAEGGSISAPQDGRVRIYDWNGTAWTQVGQSLTGAQSDYYGVGNMGFSDDGSRFITSSPNDGTPGGGSPNAGVVEVYYLVGGTWTILGTPFTSSVGDDQVGKSCAISGDGNTIAFVDYQYDDPTIGVNSGRTRVFTWNGTTWVQKGSDMIGDVPEDGMGRVMEMTGDGNYIIIGNYSAGSNNGKVWIYAWDGSNWVKRGNTLVGTGADLLGFDVTISDDANTIAIGENHNDVIGTEAGAVEIRTWNGSAYVLTHTLYDPEATSGRFGSAVALSGDGTRLVAVTHHYPAGSNSAHGRARVFEYNGTSWELRVPVTSIGALGNQGTDGSGSALGQEDALAISRDGSVIVVGLPNDDTSGNANSGQAKVFHMPSNIKSIWGSNDDVNWTKITTGNKTFRVTDRLEFKNLDNPNYYKYHAIVADAFTRLKDIKLYGIRNQGSSTLHDGTLTLTKKVTAPQLESTGIINMKGDYTEIRANSNVVTEFNRSKKLIKYPRVALTSASQDGYNVTFSHENVSYRAWEAFDANPGDTVGWHSADATGSTIAYNGTGGLYSGTTRLATETELGEWLGLELPEAIKLMNVNMVSQSYSPATNTIDNFVVYAKKQSGDTWTSLGTFTGVAGAQNSAAGVTVNVDANDYYKFFAIVATKRDSAGTNTGVSIRDLSFFGTPEYDPEAHGTDVVVKSVPNVPNTDWLEVYYEGKNYTSGNTVQDETTNDIDGTFTGITYNTEYNSFDFSGVSSSSKITATLPSTFAGNQPFTVSVWFKRNNDLVNENTIWRIGPRTDEKCLGLAVSNGNFNFFGNDSTDGSFSSTTFNGGGYVVGRWYHVACVYDGSSRYIFIDSVRDGTTVTNSLDFNASTELVLGFNGVDKYLNGSIANFRLFNRALTSDEIWQFYAYQKEYFGHGDLGMTLKNGRLGIGTSEPQAALDVRGDANFNFAYRELHMYSKPDVYIYNSSGTALTLPYNASGKYLFFRFPNYYSKNFEPIIASDYRYYVPENGLYFVRFTPFGGGATSFEWFINKNRNSRNNNNDINYNDGFGPYVYMNSVVSGTLSAIIPMTTTDYITFGVYTGSTSFDMNNRSSACITLIQRF